MKKFRKRVFAWIMAKSDRSSHLLYGHNKKELFVKLKGLVVEIGPGSGINFRYFPDKIDWVGVEPNEAFHQMLLRQAGIHGIKARIIRGDASRIPLEDGAADCVVSTLVLCSVVNIDTVIGEIRRILRPGGTFVFLEHVGAPLKSTLRIIQDIWNPVNRLMADGCNCNRETGKHIRNGGFSQVDVSNMKMKGTLPVHSPHIYGYAIK